MGIAHYSDVVPFVVHCIWETQSLCALPLGVRGLCVEEGRSEIFSESGLEIGDMRGWEHKGAAKIGNRTRIYAGVVTKGDWEVYIVNESPHESVGCYLMAAVATRRADLQAFIDDWRDTFTHKYFQYEIEDTDSVCRYL